MTEREETSASGSPIYRHQPRENQWSPPTRQDGEAISKIETHIDKNIGAVDVVWHEIISDLVHIDVHHAPPSNHRDFHTLITTGMSDRPMNVPQGLEDLRYAELMIYLPSSWPLSFRLNTESELSDERYYWPIRWVKMLARLPHEFNTWLGYCHSVPNGDPPEPFAPGTDLSGVMLIYPVLEPEEFTPLEINPEKKIHFWALLPIYSEEMRYKLDHGGDALLDHLAAEHVSPVVNPTRRNVCSGYRE